MQPDCVAAINAFVDELTPSGLVVCCRLNEYRWLPERLKLNGAICLEPLSEDEVAEYLTKGGAELATLREAVNTDSVLQELAQTLEPEIKPSSQARELLLDSLGARISFAAVRRWIFALLLCIATLVVRAEPLERAEVTKAVNVVSLLPGNSKATPATLSREIVRSRQEAIRAPSWSSPTSRLPASAPMRSSASCRPETNHT
jgi:hypothetical protein